MNPFVAGAHPLKNIYTHQVVAPQISRDILNIFDTGITLYESFRKERFIDKSKSLSATIKRVNFPTFTTPPKAEKNNIGKNKKVTTNEVQRILAIAHERNYPLEKLLCYDLTYQNQLFDVDGYLKRENDKSSLCRELEKILVAESIEYTVNDACTCMLIDVMLLLRKISWKNKRTFADLASSFCSFVVSQAAFHKSSRIDLLFDSYFEK